MSETEYNGLIVIAGVVSFPDRVEAVNCESFVVPVGPFSVGGSVRA